MIIANTVASDLPTRTDTIHGSFEDRNHVQYRDQDLFEFGHHESLVASNGYGSSGRTPLLATARPLRSAATATTLYSSPNVAAAGRIDDVSDSNSAYSAATMSFEKNPPVPYISLASPTFDHRTLPFVQQTADASRANVHGEWSPTYSGPTPTPTPLAPPRPQSTGPIGWWAHSLPSVGFDPINPQWFLWAATENCVGIPTTFNGIHGIFIPLPPRGPISTNPVHNSTGVIPVDKVQNTGPQVPRYISMPRYHPYAEHARDDAAGSKGGSRTTAPISTSEGDESVAGPSGSHKRRRTE